MADTLLSIVLSFRNEEAVIPELIDRLERALDPLPLRYEIIFVDDDSTDGSLELLRERARTDPHIRVLRMSRRFGVSQCVLAGMKYASGDAVIYLDADLQDPPELIPELIERWREGADVVYTVRTSRAGENAFKMWVTRQAYRTIHRFSREIDLPVNAGDFKLLSRRVVDELLLLDEQDPFLRGLVTWVGFRQVPVHYNREKRYAGRTHFPLLGGGPAQAFIAAITSFSVVPLQISLILGFLVSAGAFLYLVAVIVMFYMGINIPGWSAIMVTMLFLGGTQLFVVGVLGLYVGRIYNEVKGRPSYIVASTIGFDEPGSRPAGR